MDLYNLIISAKLTKGGGGGGGDIDVESLSVTENGTYTAPSGKAYSPVTVSVPASGITPTGTKAITSNGMYDVTDFASASINVPVGVFPSGTKSIAENGIYDITNFSSVDVNVSGGGGDHDAEDGIIMKTISGAYTNSRVTYIGDNAFNNCRALTSANFPNVTYIGGYAFNSCNALASVSFPNATSIENYAFALCRALTSANFPNATSIGGYAFNSCRALTSANFPNATYIGTQAFNSCRALTSVNFLASSVASLGNTNAFNNTPMSNSTYTGSFGSIYVPASLVDSYKAANLWSYYADRITAYEGE